MTVIRRLAFCLVAALSNFVPHVAADESQPLVLIDGKIEEVRLSSIGESGITVLDSLSAVRTLSHQDMVRWGSLTEREQTPQVRLIDGSVLIGEVTRVTRTQLIVETDIWGELTLPVDVVSNVVWSFPTDPNLRERFRDGLRIKSQTSGPSSPSGPLQRKSASKLREKIQLNNGDSLQGRLLSADSQFVKFQTDNGDMELRRELVVAWSKADSTATQGHVIGFRDGTKLVVRSVRMEQRFEVDLVCGQHLGSLLEVRPIEEGLVCYVRPNHPHTRYLSDITPLGHKHIPFLTTSWPWGRDRNVLGGPITSHARTFAKGIGMHSTSRLAFDLPEGFDEFQSEVSIDRSAGTGGSVVLRVFTSSEGAKWASAYKSEVIRGGEEPPPVRVDVRGAKRLALVVDFAERGDVLDRANWIGARLVRKAP